MSSSSSSSSQSSSSSASAAPAASAVAAPTRKRPLNDGADAPPPLPPHAAPFLGPAADSPLGELLLDVLPVAFRNGNALELHRMRGLCGLTLRERAALGGAVATPYGGGELVERRAADGVRVVRLAWATLFTHERVDERGFRGGAADVMARALEAQAPWLRAARGAPRKQAEIQMWGCVERTTCLVRAADAGDERRVRELLAACAPSHCVDGLTKTALHYASRHSDVRIVKALLVADAAGKTLDAQDRNRWTPLMLASMNGHEDNVCALLARGARQELQSSDGRTAMHKAAWGGHAGIVELLCAGPGAATALAQRDNYGRTPLAAALRPPGPFSTATTAGQDACAAILRAHGAT